MYTVIAVKQLSDFRPERVMRFESKAEAELYKSKAEKEGYFATLHDSKMKGAK